jgi:hypothetical protein
MAASFSEALSEFTGVFRGDGVNHEKVAFLSQFTGEPILGGRAFRIQLVANNSESQVLYEEEATLWPEEGDQLKMYNFNTITGLTVLERVPEPQGVNGDSKALLQFATPNLGETDKLRLRVTLRKAGSNSLEYLYEWGMPGKAFEPKTTMVLKRY